MNTLWLGTGCPYDEVLKHQEELVETYRDAPNKEATLLLLEHAPVYTIGRTRDHSSLREPTLLPHPVVEINRGGQATYHGPGQVVGYPILHLEAFGRDIRRYVEALEEALIATCAEYGVRAHTREGLIGIWIGERKLASLGVGLRHWVTMHGFALNLRRESLFPFLAITPCGIDGVTMTCLENELPEGGTIPDAETFGRSFARHFLSFIPSE